jgi:hypothetical protein
MERFGADGDRSTNGEFFVLFFNPSLPNTTS